MISSTELFFDMNAILWHKKIVRRSIKNDKRKKGGKDAASDDDVFGLLGATTKLVEKALIHFLSSTGIRPNGIAEPVLAYDGLERMPDDCYAIIVYDESEEGYWAFLTPEASRALDRYLNMRKSGGEEFNDDTALFLKLVIPQTMSLIPSYLHSLFLNASELILNFLILLIACSTFILILLCSLLQSF